MASMTIGRTNCPVNCGHSAAQVKIKTDKAEGKTAYPYVHCAACGVQMHTRTDDQAKALAKITRAEKGATAAPEAKTAPPSDERTPVDTSAATDTKKAPGGLFSGFGLGGF